MSFNLLGTVLASPVVTGNYSTDTYGTHYSFLGVGGWQELGTLSERNAIPTDALGNVDPSGLSSGRRRLGMLVYVGETDTIYQLFVPYGTFTGMTASAKVAALADNNNWVEFTSQGGGDAIKKRIQQNGHGFSVGNVVSYNGSIYVKGIASVGNTYEFLGVVSSVIDVDNFTLTYAGYIDLTPITGLSANTVYFVSPSVAGAITPIEPYNSGESSRPMIITQGTTNGLVLMSRSFTVSESGSGGTGGGNGMRIQRVTSQTAHGFSLGDVLIYTGGTYHKALASKVAHHSLGVVNQVVSPNSFSLCFGGYVDGLTAAFDYTGTKHLSGSTVYYLSNTVAGKLTSIKPTAFGQYVKPVYQALTTDSGIVTNLTALPTYIPISGVTGLTAALNSKINTSLIGMPNGIPPLNNTGVIPFQYIPAGLKEEYVVKTIQDRDALFFASGDTGTTAQTMSFRGLRVFVLNASGATGLPTGYTGSSEFIDTTGLLNWSATTGVVYIRWNDILQKPNIVNRVFAGSGMTVSNNGTGNTTVTVRYDNKYIDLSGNNLQVKGASIDATRVKFQASTGTTGQYIVRGTGSTFNAITLPNAVIGPAEDGSYTDGIYTDFTASTPVGTAVDRFNELFLLVLPEQPAALTSLNGSGTFVSGKLSWGISRNDISYANVGTTAGNPAVDINGVYSNTGTTRLGITRTVVTGILNSSVVGNISGIPFVNYSFKQGDQGKLVVLRNGTKMSTLNLTGTTAATSNAWLSVSAVQNVKAQSGNPVPLFKYRTGTYTIPLSGMTNGWNYIRIVHSGGTVSTTQTNYIEFVYDADSSNLTPLTTGLTNITLSGTKNVSGVKYHTSGTIQYQATITNAYKNVYSDLSNAIDFPTRENLSTMTTMDVTGAGLINRTGSALQTFPNLNSAASNPQNTAMSILATFNITPTVLLGNVGSIGRVRSNISVAHPFTAQQYSGGLDTKTGFLIYNVTQANVNNSETYTGEVNRLEARNYAALTYANVNAGTYAWDSTVSLIGVNNQHNTGMLVFNDELVYPNAAYLTTQYGITTGNFAGVTNTPASNVNYTSASGIRNHYRKFTSAAGTTQSTLTFTIDHTGSSSDFLTNGGTGGTASVNNIKLEFLIMRSGGQIHGWANPFASSGNPEGIANTSVSHVGTVTTVTCTLSTVPRVASGDFVIVRTFHASGYTNRLRTLSITNI